MKDDQEVEMTKNRKIKNTIFKIVEKIKEEYRPEKIILFGSYAYGTPNKNSDVDLFILKSTKKNRIDRFVEVKRIIYDPKIKLVFSPLVYTPREAKRRISLGDDFVKEILEKGEVLYVRQKENNRRVVRESKTRY